MKPAVAAHGLEKRFGNRSALNRLDLVIPRGTICGLLGHNGAGKSTFIGLALGQLFPDAGRVEIAGHDVAADRASALAKVGAMYETPAFYDYLSGEVNLRILCEFTSPCDAARFRKVVHLVGLSDRIRDRVATYSHGMRQRLALAQALLPDPDLLILDEPADGLDPDGIREIRSLLRRLNERHGITIILSSHILPEVEKLCRHVVLLNQGNLLYAGPWPAALGERTVELIVDHPEEAARALRDAGLAEKLPGTQSFRLRQGVAAHEVATWLVRSGYSLSRIREVFDDLEEFYISQTARIERKDVAT